MLSSCDLIKYTAAKVEVATANDSGGDAFT